MPVIHSLILASEFYDNANQMRDSFRVSVSKKNGVKTLKIKVYDGLDYIEDYFVVTSNSIYKV